MYRALIRNITPLGVASLVAKPIWLLFLVSVCPRLLGTELYGIFTASLALAVISLSFSDLGMAQYSLREVSRRHRLAGRHLMNLGLLRLTLLLLGCCVAMASAWVLGYRGIGLAAVAFACLYWVGQNFGQYCQVFYRAFQRLHFEGLSTLVEKTLVIAIGVAFLWTTKAPHWTLLGMAIGMVLVTCGNAIVVSRRFVKVSRRILSLSFLRRSVPGMLPLGLAGALVIVYFRIDIVMVEAMLGAEPAGQYGQAFRILEALSLLPSIVVTSTLFPRFSVAASASDREALRGLFRFGIWVLLLSSVSISAVLTALAPKIISLLAPDPGFVPAGSALRVLAWTFPFTCMNNLMYALFISRDRHRTPLLLLVVASVFNVTLNAFLIPRYGISGAAAVTVASEIVMLCGYVVWGARNRILD